jgi:hypothetical protein
VCRAKSEKDERQSGRLCFLTWSVFDRGDMSRQQPNVSLLSECLPKDSVFFAEACEWDLADCVFATLQLTVVAPHRLGLDAWLSIWDEVEGVIRTGHLGLGKPVELVEPGCEADALAARAVWFRQGSCGVQMGSFASVKDALGVVGAELAIYM